MTSCEGWVEALRGLAAARLRIVAAGGWTVGPSTLMAVLERERAEVANCRVVRWLFDPIARHGIGTAMVSALADRLEVTVAQPTLVRASAEVVRGGCRADVVLAGLDAGRAIIIEAKIDAAEGERQGARLEAEFGEAERFVFLTIAGEHLPSTAERRDMWRPLSWGWIADAAAHCVERTPVPKDPRGKGSRAGTAASRQQASGQAPRRSPPSRGSSRCRPRSICADVGTDRPFHSATARRAQHRRCL